MKMGLGKRSPANMRGLDLKSRREAGEYECELLVHRVGTGTVGVRLEVGLEREGNVQDLHIAASRRIVRRPGCGMVIAPFDRVNKRNAALNAVRADSAPTAGVRYSHPLGCPRCVTITATCCGSAVPSGLRELAR